MSHRQQQLESTLQRAISQVIAQRLSDPRIAGLVSITRVQVSPDRHNAYVYVSVLPEEHEKLTMHGLQSATGRIQTLLRKAVAVRTLPALEFRLDKSIKKEAAAQHAIHQAMENEPPVVVSREGADERTLPDSDTPLKDSPT